MVDYQDTSMGSTFSYEGTSQGSGKCWSVATFKGYFKITGDRLQVGGIAMDRPDILIRHCYCQKEKPPSASLQYQDDPVLKDVSSYTWTKVTDTGKECGPDKDCKCTPPAQDTFCFQTATIPKPWPWQGDQTRKTLKNALKKCISKLKPCCPGTSWSSFITGNTPFSSASFSSKTPADNGRNGDTQYEAGFGMDDTVGYGMGFFNDGLADSTIGPLGDEFTRSRLKWVEVNKNWLKAQFGDEWEDEVRILRESESGGYTALKGHAGNGHGKKGKYVVINHANQGWRAIGMDNTGEVVPPA
jgi:hypothetical protein